MKATLNAATLAAITKATGSALSKDKARPHLGGISVSVTGDTFTMSATDSYRAHIGTMPATFTGDMPENALLLDGSALVTAITNGVRDAKKQYGRGALPTTVITVENYKNATVETYATDDVTTYAPVSSYNVSILPLEFPALGFIFDTPASDQAATGAIFNADYIAAAYSAAGLVSDRARIETMALLKPAVISADNGVTGATFRAAVMPQRA